MGSGSRCSEHWACGVLGVHRDWCPLGAGHSPLVLIHLPCAASWLRFVLCPCLEAGMALDAVGSCGAGLGWFGLDLGALALQPYGALSLGRCEPSPHTSIPNAEPSPWQGSHWHSQAPKTTQHPCSAPSVPFPVSPCPVTGIPASPSRRLCRLPANPSGFPRAAVISSVPCRLQARQQRLLQCLPRERQQFSCSEEACEGLSESGKQI